MPDTPGIPQAAVDQVLTLSYRQPESLDKIRKHSDELAAVIIEPVPSSFPVDMGDFLRELREVTRECGVLLIFDEVISGFRLGYGGAQERFGITPDIATYGKIMGGGFPAGAIAGSVDALQPLITSGDALQDLQEKVLIVGTFSGNPVTASAGTPRSSTCATTRRSTLTSTGSPAGSSRRCTPSARSRASRSG